MYSNYDDYALTLLLTQISRDLTINEEARHLALSILHSDCALEAKQALVESLMEVL